MGARRPPPDPDARRPAGADRPCTAPPAQLLVEGSGAGGGRHHPAHPQGRAVIDPEAQIIPATRGSGVMENVMWAGTALTNVLSAPRVVRRFRADDPRNSPGDAPARPA